MKAKKIFDQSYNIPREHTQFLNQFKLKGRTLSLKGSPGV